MENKQFSDQELDELWKKALFISRDNEGKGFRKDEQGNWICRHEYGNRKSEYGWFPIKIEHNQGTNQLNDYTPVHWKVVDKLGQPSEPKYRLKMLPIESISAERINQLWQMAVKHSADNEQKGFRVDIFGQWVGHKNYGEQNSPYGWAAVLVYDISNKGADKKLGVLPINLQLLLTLQNEMNKDEEGWTVWDTACLSVNALQFGFDFIGASFSAAFSAPFSFFDI